MPVRWTTTPTGERFLEADRKNRIERARLDLQLRIYEREKLRGWGLAEKERKILVSNMEVLKRTTGTCRLGVEPGGEGDSYQRSMHSRSSIRLSEKRLKAWKQSERQLQRFLKEKAVPVDDVILGDSRPLATRSALTDELNTSASAKDIHGGKAEKERAEVQRRVSAFLHSGLHVSARENKPPLDRRRSSTGDPKKKVEVKDSARQRHHSDVVRPHTAQDKTDGAGKPPIQRPVSAHVPKKSQFIITKGDVFMNCGSQLVRISGSSTDIPKIQHPSETPKTKLNNYVAEYSRSNSTLSSESDLEQDIFIDDRLYANTRLHKPASDTEDARSETRSIISEPRSIMSDKSSGRKLSKHVSIGNQLDELTEEQLHRELRDAPQSTARPFSSGYAIGAPSSRASSRHRGSSARFRQNAQTPTVVELEDVDDHVTEADVTSRTSHTRHKDFENPNMYDITKVTETMKCARVFSKSARKKALENLVNENSPDKREVLRQERLRQAKARSALLTTITGRFRII